MTTARAILLSVVVLAYCAGASVAQQYGPADHSTWAHDFLAKKANHAAAGHVRQDLDFLVAAAKDSDGAVKLLLDRTIASTTQVATQLDEGKLTRIEQLDPELAAIHHALGTYQRSRTAALISKSDKRQAAVSLAAAAQNVELGYKFTGDRVPLSARKLIQKSKDLAERVKRGTAYHQGDISGVLNDLQAELIALDQAVRKARK